MLRLTAAPLLVLASLTAGCFDDSSASVLGSYPTLLTVDSAQFRGALTCGAPGLAMFVVTLTDVSVVGYLTLPSSVPVPCDSVLSFSRPTGALGDQYIVAGHFYIGSIDGYDRDDMVPSEPGGRDMVDPSGAVVTPRWMTTCGEVPPRNPTPSGDGGDAGATDGSAAYNPLRFPTLAVETVEVVLRGCLPLAGAPAPDASTSDDAADHRADAAAEVETGTNTTVDASGEGAADGAIDDGPDDGSQDDDGG